MPKLSRTKQIRNIYDRVTGVKLPASTEWVLHCATTLAQLEPGSTASAAQLAEYYDLPAPYLAKQLQALVRAGVLVATTGPRGGFRLARPAAEITLLDIVEAVDGSSSPYECREIRQRGAGALPEEDCRDRCVLARKMADAHQAWRASLAADSLAGILATLPEGIPARTRSRLATTTRGSGGGAERGAGLALGDRGGGADESGDGR